MKFTLLELIKKVAAKIHSDEVTELDENIEAVNIRQECQATFDDLIAGTPWEFLDHIPTQLAVRTVDEEDNPTQPKCVLNAPSDVAHIEALMYEYQTTYGVSAQYSELTYLKPVDFQRVVLARESDSTIDECVVNGVTLRIKNNANPRYYTTFDERVIVFDSYDSVVDPDGIDATKTSCIARKYMSAESGADWQPDVPEFFFNLWYHESVARCSSSIAGVEDGRSERMARRAEVTAIRMDNLGSPNYVDDGVNYGR